MYKVTNRFKDRDGHVYEVGDSYPKDGKTPMQKRIDELSKSHPKYGVSFVEVVEEDEKPAKKKTKKKE